jgi:hypothetical protein
MPMEFVSIDGYLRGTSRVGVVYVPIRAPSPANLRIGLEQGVWGFSEEAMGRSNYLQDFRLLSEGDMLFLGHGGPTPRVSQGGWADKQLQVAHLGVITQVEEDATDMVWPDGLYPYRLFVEFMSERKDVDALSVGAGVMEALRLSANQQGRVVVLPLSGLILAGGTGGLAEPLALDGPLERMVERAERREQDKLRRQRLGSAALALCDLCGRRFPVRYLRMAHIKKRSLCSDEEKLDPNVVMAACIECDALFEAKELVVDATGVIRAVARSDATADLQLLLDARVGRSCAAFSDATSKYFEFHRERSTDYSTEPVSRLAAS